MKPSANTIKNLVRELKKIEDSYYKALADSHDFRFLHEIEIIEGFLNPLYCAWEYFGFGNHTDFWKEGDSTASYTVFEVNCTERIRNAIAYLREGRIFDELVDTYCTDWLINVYSELLSGITDRTLPIRHNASPTMIKEKNNHPKKWIILECKRICVAGFGYCAIVKANPLREIYLTNGRCVSQSYTDYECDETQSFLIPEQSSYIQEVAFHAQKHTPWTPNLTDFSNDMVFDQISQDVVRAYFHRSFDEIRGKEFKSNLVPDEKSLDNTIDDLFDSLPSVPDNLNSASGSDELPF